MFTRPGSDMAMTNRDAGTGLYSFDWDSTGEPTFDDTQAHRVLTQLIEHRASASSPGYWDDPTGKHGSLLYTVRETRRGTPSQVEAYAADALDKCVLDKALTYDPEDVTARSVGPTRIDLAVTYTAAGRTQTVGVTVGK